MGFRDNLHFVVADDHALVRQSVKMMLEVAFDACSVSEARDFDSALAAVNGRMDAFLLIDLSMPGMDGVESLRALRETFPNLRMAVLSGDESRSTIMGAVTAGVNGYIVKASPSEEFRHAIETILSGRIYITNQISKFEPVNIQSYAVEPIKDKPISDIQSFTARQKQVIGWLMKGHSNKQIAHDLGIGEGTVKVHLAGVFRALGATSRTEVVSLAMRQGL